MTRLALCLCAILVAACTHSSANPRVTFWKDVHAAGDAPPAGSDVAALAHELVGLLRSPDPEVRDGLATNVLERWIRRDARLTPEQLRPVVAELYEGLHAGIGARGDDSVFGRSFSALVLSMVAARDVATPFLSEAELAAMATNAAWYADAEKDLRGYVESRGWAHAAAHTADWLRWLAAHEKLAPASRDAILAAVLSLTVRRHGEILHYGEDGRLAQPVLQLLKKSHVDAATFSAWLEKLAAPLLEEPGATFDPAQFAAQRNSRNLIFTLFVALSMEDAPNAPQAAALAALRDLIRR